LDEREFRRRFPNASRSAIAANVGPEVSNAEPEEQARALDGHDAGETQGAGCPLVRFTLRRVKLLDVDAKFGSIKDLLDALQYAGAIRGDREGQIRLEVLQEKVKTYAQEETQIEVIP
jgi:hypothetical protein